MKTFRLTETHLKLLNHAYVSWDDGEFGAPGINCKRPYGNSDVYGDLAELLGVNRSEDERFDGSQLRDMETLHRETETALQILLLNAGRAAVTGLYRQTREYDSRSWQRVGD